MEAQGPQGTPPGWHQNPQGPPPNKSLRLLQVILAALLAVAVLVVGFVALTGGGEDEVDDRVKRDQSSNAITNEQAQSLKPGTTRGAVESRFGPPRPDQEGANEGLGTNEGLGDDTCIYYNLKEGELLNEWQFCFRGAGKRGKLTTKNRL